MPIYEYRCNSCHHRVSILIRSFGEFQANCPNCGSTELTRLFSTFSAHTKSDIDVLEDVYSDSRLQKGVQNGDPRALAEWSKRISRGEGIGGSFDAMIQEEADSMPE